MINEIKIENYKCFESFEASGFKRINLISGKNNVGKTALMEAVCIFIQKSNIGTCLANLPQLRDIYGKGLNGIYGRKLVISNKSSSFNIEFHADFKKVLINTSTSHVELVKTDISPFIFIQDDTCFISSKILTNKLLADVYAFIQNKKLQPKMFEYAKLLDERIEWIEPQKIENDVVLKISVRGVSEALLASQLGEGTSRLITFISCLVKLSGGTLFIDEIENGFHYSKLKDVWKIIITVAQKEDVQVFATTHDNETIKALYEAAKELEFQDLSLNRLSRKDEKIINTNYDFDHFAAEVETNQELRGW